MSRRRDRHDHLARTPVYLLEDAKDGGHRCRACASAIVRARRHHLLRSATPRSGGNRPCTIGAERRLYGHMPAWHVRDYLGEAVWCYFKFAFDRNPWDRQVSWYLYKTKSKRARPSFERFMASRTRVYVDNYQLATTSRGRPRRP